jgi:L-arabinose isomerase
MLSNFSSIVASRFERVLGAHMISRSLRISPTDCRMEVLDKGGQRIRRQFQVEAGTYIISSLKVGTEYQDVVALNSRVDDEVPPEGIPGDKVVWDIEVRHAWVQSGYHVCQ